MTKRAPRSRIAPAGFQEGQVWGFKDSNLRIGMVGKTLVHYKHFRGELKRAPVSLSSKVTLEKYLKHNKAVLVQS